MLDSKIPYVKFYTQLTRIFQLVLVGAMDNSFFDLVCVYLFKFINNDRFILKTASI